MSIQIKSKPHSLQQKILCFKAIWILRNGGTGKTRTSPYITDSVSDPTFSVLNEPTAIISLSYALTYTCFSSGKSIGSIY